MNEIEQYFDGKLLYGDDFDESQIEEWFADEKEGYASLGVNDVKTYNYGYHALNNYHGFKYLPNREFKDVLGFGSAFGEELLPILSKIKTATIVDPSDAFVRDSFHDIPLNYVQPSPNGKLPFSTDTFDLITCFGVLHHIPNVSTVFSELARVLKPNGYILMREPIVSMGDWRHPRPGLTMRERGIPLKILQNIVKINGMETIKLSLCDFPISERIFLRLGIYNTFIASLLDAWVAAAFAWNLNYHPSNFIKRFRPRSAFFVLRKP